MGNSRIVYRFAAAGVLLAVAILLSQPSQGQQPRGGGQNQTSGVVESRGVRLQVPSGWSCNQDLLADAGPIALTNFRAYIRGGILPPGGAEIEITSVPAPPSLPDFIRAELPGTSLDPLRSYSDSGKTGIQAAYTFEVGAGAIEKNIAVYIPHGPALYKFYLSYWNGDRNEGALLDALSRVVRGAQLR